MADPTGSSSTNGAARAWQIISIVLGALAASLIVWNFTQLQPLQAQVAANQAQIIAAAELASARASILLTMQTQVNDMAVKLSAMQVAIDRNTSVLQGYDGFYPDGQFPHQKHVP